MRCEKGNYFFVLTSYYCKYFLFGFDSIGFFLTLCLTLAHLQYIHVGSVLFTLRGVIAALIWISCSYPS